MGQPSLLIDVDRAKIARYGINVADVEAVIQAAVGGQAATQVIQGEKLFDLVVRMQPQFRRAPQEIGNLLVGTPDGQQIPLEAACRHHGKETAPRSFIAKIIRATSASSTALRGGIWSGPCAMGRRPCARQCTCRQGYRMEWGGEYSEFLAARGPAQCSSARSRCC